MASSPAPHGGLEQLASLPRFSLAQLPTPIHRLENFVRHAGDIDLWIKRDDLTGLVGGGNKTRKLEFLIGDAKARGFDMLVTVGAIQSNHTRQTAAAAAKAGMKQNAPSRTRDRWKTWWPIWQRRGTNPI